MASIIRIKRSASAEAPATLAAGELAYSSVVGTSVNGGDRLYIGALQSDDSIDVNIIGGKYFTDMLDHTPGTLTASSAIVVDANSKIDQLNIDNITIDGNTISSTNTNGNISISPNGDGSVDVVTSKIVNVIDPTQDQDAATKKYVDDVAAGITAGQVQSLNFSIADNQSPANTDTITTGTNASTLIFAGTNGVSTTVSNDQVEISLVQNLTPEATVEFAELLTDVIDSPQVETVTGADFSFDATAGTITSTAVDFTTFTVGHFINISGGTNDGVIAQISAVTSNTLTITDPSLFTTADDTGTAVTVSSFVDFLDVRHERVRLKSLADASNRVVYTSANGEIVTSDQFEFNPSNSSLKVGNLSFDGDGSVEITTTETDGNITISPNGTGEVVISGDLRVNGTTTVVNTETLEVADNIILLNSNVENTTDPTENAGITVNRGSQTDVTFSWIELGVDGSSNDLGGYWSTGIDPVTGTGLAVLEATIDGGTYD